MPTVQQPAAAVQQLTAVEWPQQLTQVMPTLQQPEQQHAAVEWP